SKAQLILSPNFVVNPSFENYTNCPSNFGQIYYAYSWSDCLKGMGSTDYYNICNTSTWMIQFINIQHPRTGNGEAGGYMYGSWLGDNYRDYIMGNLSDSLKYNKRYCGGFYTSLLNTCKGAVDNIGMFFSVDTIYNSLGCLCPFSNFQPQIENHNGVIMDTVNWVKVYGTFKAMGGEQHITIGNFKDNIHTNFISLPYGPLSPYYLFDDVSVCECSFNFNLGNDTTLCTGNSFILKPNMPNAIYTWQDSSNAAIYTVTQPGTYWVRAFFPNYIVNHEGLYWVNVINNVNCMGSDSIKVTYIAPPNFASFNDTTLCEGTPLVITIPYGAYNILWGDGVTNFNHMFYQAGAYNFTASNMCGTLSESFNVIYKDCNNYLYFPNALTLNDDGLNDKFCAYYTSKFDFYRLYIYNRWGQLLFETSDPNLCWDGKFKNEKVKSDVYVWRVKYASQFTNGVEGKYGTVTVVR
ncbi:MAG: gliding motility-associated C-terminal domain-containing protein, partial [Ignavibacteriae bacterium]|nr:gliding motility-associated C-terminal domain-containing protein [Ignavibacteriota bacterium]